MTLMPVAKISTEVLWSTKRRRLAVNAQRLLGVHRPLLVHRPANDVQNAAEHFFANRHLNRRARVRDLGAAH